MFVVLDAAPTLAAGLRFEALLAVPANTVANNAKVASVATHDQTPGLFLKVFPS